METMEYSMADLKQDKQMNQKTNQQYASPDAGQRNFMGQRTESNSSLRKLLQLIYSRGVC